MHFSLVAGLTFRQGQRTLELVRELDKSEYLIEDVITRRSFTATAAQLVSGFHDGKYQLIKHSSEPVPRGPDLWPALVDLASLTEHERKGLEQRLAYIKQLRRLRISKGQRAKVALAIKKFAEFRGEKAPSASAVMMWVRNYERSGNNPLAIVDKHRVGKRVKRLRNEAEKIVWQVLKREYFTTKQQSIKHAHRQLEIALKRAYQQGILQSDEAAVSYQTVARRIKDVDFYHRIASRQGPTQARMQCRSAFPEGVATYPYQKVEIDHTPLNWVVICDRTGLPLGRPTLTVMIDAFSGYILGFYISFYGPGLTSVCGVVRNALQPKADMIKSLKLENEWLSCGLGDEWVIDNGLEFHSFGFKTMAMSLGVDLMFCRVRTPWLKPHVERFFSTLNTLTLTKGRVTKSVGSILRIDPYKDAAITFTDLINGLLMFVVDVYPHQPNWRKMATPFTLFQEGIERVPPARYPGTLDQLRLAAGMSRMLTVNQGGIEFTGLPYGSYAFKDVFKRHGSKLKLLCKWDPDDISTLHFLDPDGVTWHEAQCRWPQYASGLSFNQHRLIRKFAKEDLQSVDRMDSLARARQRLHDHWLDATSRRGRVDELTAGRYADLTSHKVMSPSSAQSVSKETSATQLLSESEYKLSEKDIPQFETFSF